ncbi:MtrB/PioB family outer membrane beta-barrel protein [Thioflavicoccus mobilis]|nr:MtrB/PioB family outer membrane beta-barrel protein [Thioflavicoccus mobilis]
MTTRFRLKLLSSCVGAAVVQAAAPALADSAVGVDTMLGNALNPTTINQLERLDPEGLDARINTRTPTGQLYAWDPLPREQQTSSSGWLYSGSIEAGGTVVSGDDDSGWFRMYKDLDTGLYLNNLEFQAHQPESALFVEGVGGALGYDDQYYGLKFGRYNDWYGKLFYQETPHTFTSQYRSLWTDTNDDYLKLRNLMPGGYPAVPDDPATPEDESVSAQDVTSSAIIADIEATDFSDLGIIRRKGGISLEKYLTDNLKLLASYSLEHRDGSRPFGARWGGGGGSGNIEIPEPIDYDTHDIVAVLRYDDGVNNANLTVTGSLFRNNHDTLTFENPIAYTGGLLSSYPTGTFDLYPDNDYWNVKGEYARSMPDFYDGRFTALASFSWMKQDDDLIPWTQYDLAGTNVDGVDATNMWNTTDALVRDSADAEIDTMLFDVGLSLHPTDKLGLNGKIRYYETDNKTDFLACNPLTGQWGRLVNDGSNAATESGIVTAGVSEYLAAGCDLAAARALGTLPQTGNVKLRTVPFDYSQWNYVLGGDYRLTPSQTLNLKLEREEIDRNHRERDTWENSAKLTYVNRGFDFGTLRLSADYGQRRGDSYVTDPYEEYVSASLGPLPTADGFNVRSWIHTLNEMRKFDLADRNHLNLNGRLNLIVSDPLDIGLTLNYKDDEYPNSDFGRKDHHWTGTGTMDVNYQPSEKLNLYGFYTYQQSHIEQANVASVPTCAIGGAVTADNFEEVCGSVGTAGTTLYPTGNIWGVEGEEHNNVFGLGGSYDLGVTLLSLDYSFIKGVYDTDLSSNGPINPEDIFPNYEYTQHILDLSAFFPISKTLGIRALYRYEMGKIDDWHYDGVEENPNPSASQYYLDSGLDDYDNSTVGLFVHVNF